MVAPMASCWKCVSTELCLNTSYDVCAYTHQSKHFYFPLLLRITHVYTSNTFAKERAVSGLLGCTKYDDIRNFADAHIMQCQLRSYKAVAFPALDPHDHCQALSTAIQT
jgi:hypothetical protein